MFEPAKSLISGVEKFLTRLPVYLHCLVALVAFTLTRVANLVLDASYAASQYPVPFYVGQTAFSGAKLKTYYAHMIERGTLDVYWRTQFIDFVFILAVFTAGLVVSLFLARLHRKPSALYSFSLLAAVLVPLGATLDIVENLLSFVMLSQPTSFPNWLALVYSSFAVLKFAAIGLGYLVWLTSLLVFVFRSTVQLFQKSVLLLSRVVL